MTIEKIILILLGVETFVFLLYMFLSSRIIKEQGELNKMFLVNILNIKNVIRNNNGFTEEEKKQLNK